MAKKNIKRPAARRTPRHAVPPLERHPDNPIVAPLVEHPWESQQTFNAAALNAGGKVHLVYRSIGNDGLSRFGYAASGDGVRIDERLPYPIFSPVLEPERAPRAAGWYASGGSWGGAEDPRLAELDGRVYMLYTGFDHGGFPRVAITSIATEHFLNRQWRWHRSRFISPPNQVHKNWVLFPEKINGKFAILHSMSPTIDIEYVDDLDFEEKPYIDSACYHRADLPVPDGAWEKGVRGPGPTPLKTKYGWLVIYHGTTKDCGYKIGAMLLDLKDPTKVVARAAEPILEPAEWYEDQGYKGHIVYSCGAAIVDDALLVYYGGADSVLCVAKIGLDDFLESLIGNRTPKFRKTPARRK